MILRKPYAFLIKYFQRINIVLLLLVAFVFYKNIQILGFARDYVSTGIYNINLNPVSNYANIYVYLAFIAVILTSGVLAYLLRYKDKPYASYIIVLLVNLVTFILFIYTSNYFNYTAIKSFELVQSKIIQDLLFISSLPYYLILVILVIRSIGLDLKNFGFHEDKEFIETTESDREEVEVQVGFDKDRFIRKIKNKLRYTKYFFFEHKVPLIIVFSLVLLLFGFNFYRYFYVENRLYSINETFKSNNYKISVNNVYLTDKDYAGNIVSEKGRYFIIVSLNIENLLNVSRDFDSGKMMIYVDNDYYTPTVRFNSYFADMGNLYEGKSIKAKETVTYSLVYEINKPDDNANFLLKYQDLTSSDSKLIKVKVKVLDITTFKERGNYTFKSEAVIPLNETENVTFNLQTYEITDSISYRFQQCSPTSCPIYEGELNAPSGYKILYLRGTYGTYETSEFISFLKKYGKIRYELNGETKETPIRFIIDKNYQGRHLYLLIPNEANYASTVSLLLTIRTYQYLYEIKGE